MNSDFDIAVHPKSAKSLFHLKKSPSGSVLLVGAEGSGAGRLGVGLAHDLLGLKAGSNVEEYPYYLHIERPEKKQEISIDAIRQVTGFIKLKTPGREGLKRAIMIEDAQYLSAEAQNAILKALEEPHADTVFIIAAANEQNLLPTIVSRCQKIKVYPVGLSQAQEFYKGRFSDRSVESAWRLSQGSAELLDALLIDDKTHPLKIAVEKSKEFLKLPKPERLVMVDRLSKDKEDLRAFLDALNRVIAALYYAAQHNNKASAAKLLQDRKTVQSAITAQRLNANQRLNNLKLLTQLNT